MLILRRQVGERIIIRGPGLIAPITLTIVDIMKGYTRLGIDAPRTMSVVREELLERYESLRCDAEAKEAADREERLRK